ncbi:MAG TPA: SpoIID/LytB domain-containing protein [Actinomycetota bacterium]|nr:SpoIID/LytB domain-containing protein [Actinomycetota bacterium]
MTVIIFVVAALLAPASADIAQADTPRALTIVGHGWGHGRGMGQWGARGMAERGYAWTSILKHYYSNVRLARTRGATVRVLLERRSSFIVTSHRPYRATAGRRIVATRDRHRPYMRVRARDGVTYVDRGRSSGGPWVLAGRTRATTIAFGNGSSLMRVHRGSHIRWYRGSIRGVRYADRFMILNHLGLDAYLFAVVPREMPARWPSAALKAQSVAARTYAVRVLQHARSRRASFDICATTACQVYGGYARRHRGRMQVIEHPRTNSAVRATRGYVLTHRSRAILAEYSSSTGGWTTYGGAAYMRPVKDPYDRVSPHHRWKTTVTSAVIEERWPSLGALRDADVVSRTRRFAEGGRTRVVRLIGSRRTIRVSGDAFRRAAGLRSTWFAITDVKSASRYRFTRNMGYGMRHSAVAELQRRLRSGGYFPRTQRVTTYYGRLTRAAVVRYQRAQRISATGYLGPQTRRALNG